MKLSSNFKRSGKKHEIDSNQEKQSFVIFKNPDSPVWTFQSVQKNAMKFLMVGL